MLSLIPCRRTITEENKSPDDVVTCRIDVLCVSVMLFLLRTGIREQMTRYSTGVACSLFPVDVPVVQQHLLRAE